MSERASVAVVGADEEAVAGADEGAVAAVADAGGDPVAGPAADVVADADFVLAVGEAALLSVARAGPAVPVLPVAAGRGVRSVPRGDLEGAVGALLAGEYDVESHPVCQIRVGDRSRATALLDCMLVTAEPAQISEYAVHAGEELVARFRADGVVVATPAGSSGYASRAGGPVVSPAADVLVAAPVAPFATDADHWVLPPGDVRVSVERDVAAVDLVADDRVVGEGPPAESVLPAESLRVAVVPASGSPFRRA